MFNEILDACLCRWRWQFLRRSLLKEKISEIGSLVDDLRRSGNQDCKNWAEKLEVIQKEMEESE